MTSTLISIRYLQQVDRLSLVLTTTEQTRYEGVITRRLLKDLINRLPDWLAQQGIVRLNPLQPDTDYSPQEQQIKQHNYPQTQQIPTAQDKIKTGQETNSFLVEEISVGVENKTDMEPLIQLRLLSKQKTSNIVLSLRKQQLYQLIATMIDKASDWDLNNPWQNTITSNSSTTRQNTIH